MSMYQLPAYFAATNVAQAIPSDIMYGLPSYHDTAANASVAPTAVTGELHLFDPVKTIEEKQLALIKKLEQFGEKLNSALAEAGKSVPKASPKKAAPKDQGKQSQPVVEKENTPPEGADNKNKKESKKDAKKEARKENKAKAQGDAGTKQKTNGAAVSGETQWTVKEDKPGAESGQSLTACMPHNLSTLPVVPAGNVELSVTNDDLPWVQNLAKVASTRGVSFDGKVKNSVKGATTTVKVNVANTVSLKTKDGVVCGRVTVCKVLGSALGLFSFAPEHSVHAAHSHQWLAEVNAVLSNAQFKDTLLRSASQFLSRFDSLGGQFSVSLSDIIAYSLLSSVSNQPNNVEQWSKRVKAVLA